jgi:hypothetical protein
MSISLSNLYFDFPALLFPQLKVKLRSWRHSAASSQTTQHGCDDAMAMGVLPPSRMSLTQSFPPLQSGLKRLQNSCIAAIRRGPVPQHIAIIMDGNRRFARSNRIDTAEGHYTGAETLKNVLSLVVLC